MVGHVVSEVVEPGLNWTKVQYNGSSMDVGVRLKYSYRVLCDVNYHGVGCSVYCKSRDDVHGHYACATNGTVVCLPGWQGNFCTARWFTLRL